MFSLSVSMVTIIISYYNDRAFLSRAIKSALLQTNTKCELILVNHASSDGSREIARAHHGNRIKHIDCDRNEGASGHATLLHALSIASGSYIKFFCADDILRPYAVQNLVDAAEKHNADLVFGDMQFVNSQGSKLPLTWFTRHPFKDETEILKNYYHHGRGVLPYPSSLVRRSKLSSLNFNVGLIQMADIFLWASLILRGCKAVSVNTVCVDYRIHQQQLSSVLNVKAGPRSVHEAFLVADLLDSCSDIELIRGLWADQKHLKNPDGWCQCDIPFINAYNMANSHIYSYFYWGCVRLNQLLNSPVSARLWEQYGFGIKEYRELYSKKFSPATRSQLALRLKIRFKAWLTKLFAGKPRALDVQ